MTDHPGEGGPQGVLINEAFKFPGGDGPKIATHGAGEALFPFVKPGDIVGDFGRGVVNPL
jgi:hypothetical protein